MKDYTYFMELYIYMDEYVKNEMAKHCYCCSPEDYRRGLNFVRWEVGVSIARCYQEGLDRFDFDPVEVYEREAGFARGLTTNVDYVTAVVGMYDDLVEDFFKNHK